MLEALYADYPDWPPDLIRRVVRVLLKTLPRWLREWCFLLRAAREFLGNYGGRPPRDVALLDREVREFAAQYAAEALNVVLRKVLDVPEAALRQYQREHPREGPLLAAVSRLLIRQGRSLLAGMDGNIYQMAASVLRHFFR